MMILHSKHGLKGEREKEKRRKKEERGNVLLVCWYLQAIEKDKKQRDGGERRNKREKEGKRGRKERRGDL